MCLLHHLGSSGEVHHLPIEGEHPEGGAQGHRDARLQGLPQRFGRTVGKYVRHARQQPERLRALQATIVHTSQDLSEPEYRPLGTTRHLSCRRRAAGHQEELYWQWCALRSTPSREQGREEQPSCPTIHPRAHHAPRQRASEGGSRAHQRPRADAHAEAFVPAVLRIQTPLRPHLPRRRTAPANHPLLHLLASWLQG